MIWPFGRARIAARASERGVVLRDQLGTVITGDIDGDVVIVNGQQYDFSLHVPYVNDPVPQNIASALTWRSRIPRKLYGRDAELADLRRWCDDPAQTRIRILYGDGGAGKSRLAFELAETLREQGWQAGQIADPNRSLAFPVRGDGVLLVIDYPEQFPAAVENLLRKIRDCELPKIRLRVLLLSRNKEAMQRIVDGYVGHLHSAALELLPLSSDRVAWDLFQDGWREIGRLRGTSPATLPLEYAAFESWLRRDQTHAQPLIVLSFALNLLDEPTATQLCRAEILQHLVRRERDRIAQEMKQMGVQPEGALLFKALAAIPGQFTALAIDRMTSELARPGVTLPSLIQLQQTTLWQHRALSELQPDLLASVLIHEVLQEWLPDPQAAGEWIWLALTVDLAPQESLRGRLSRVARLSADRPRSHGQLLFPNSIVAALSSAVGLDADRAIRVDRALNHNAPLELTLRPLALIAVTQVVQVYERLAEENFDTYVLALVTSLNNLSVRLAESGDGIGALLALRRALRICERLVQRNFAACAPEVADIFNNLSVRLPELGDRARGLTAAQCAVEIYEQLVRRDFATHAPYLVASLNNLSNQLAQSGDRAGALAAIRRAVQIYEQLARESSAAFTPDLASTLNNLSNRLAESGDHAGALAAARDAVKIYERLADENFDVYGPDLATALGNLSLDLSESGNRAEGYAACRRAVLIYDQLVQENYAAFAPRLAAVLNNFSLDLAEAGHRDGGLGAIRHAVEIRERLTEENFAAHATDLAISLNNLSLQLEGSGDTPGAVAALKRAVDLMSSFVDADDMRVRHDNMQRRLLQLGHGH